TTRSGERELTRSTTNGSWFAFAQHETDSAHRMNQTCRAFGIDLPPKPGHLHVDDVVERRRAMRLLPDVPRQHFPRNEVALMPQQILEQIEFAARELDRRVAADDAPRDGVHLQMRGR